MGWLRGKRACCYPTWSSPSPQPPFLLSHTSPGQVRTVSFSFPHLPARWEQLCLWQTSILSLSHMPQPSENRTASFSLPHPTTRWEQLCLWLAWLLHISFSLPQKPEFFVSSGIHLPEFAFKFLSLHLLLCLLLWLHSWENWKLRNGNRPADFINFIMMTT